MRCYYHIHVHLDSNTHASKYIHRTIRIDRITIKHNEKLTEIANDHQNVVIFIYFYIGSCTNFEKGKIT